MSIQLQPEEQTLRDEIADRVSNAEKAFKQLQFGAELNAWIDEAGKKAHKLHMLLKARGHEPQHHGYMIKNRELQPDDPDFYKHFHPLEDLLKFLEDEHANDDPVDQTIGSEFTFRVYSKRWGHDDTYKIKRTTEGWFVSHLSINGPCDKKGRPFLIRILNQDSIQYPVGIEERMEWIWNGAANKGLTAEGVQNGIQQIADWVSTTERSAPADGIWEGY